MKEMTPLDDAKIREANSLIVIHEQREAMDAALDIVATKTKLQAKLESMGEMGRNVLAKIDQVIAASEGSTYMRLL